MSNHDPFTLDMLGGSQSALLSGLSLGVTAFADDSRTKAAEPDLPSFAQANGPTPATPSRKPDSDDTGHGSNFHLSGSRDLANGWKARARDNLDAIALAATIAAEDRPATAEEQARLIRFTGFGASNLANAIFTRPGEVGFRKGWSEFGEKLLSLGS